MPRFIIFVRGSAEAESDTKPSTKLLEAMGAYNATLSEAGILQGVDGLLPSSRDGRRINFHNSGSPTIQSGPFPANELVSGFWIVKVKDIDEAVAWASKAPFQEGGVTEIRRIAAMEDFEETMTPELREKESQLREEVEKAAKTG